MCFCIFKISNLVKEEAMGSVYTEWCNQQLLQYKVECFIYLFIWGSREESLYFKHIGYKYTIMPR